MKEHEEIHNPTIIFRGLTDSGTAVAALNASVSSASMNATLMNPGFCEDDDERMTKLTIKKIWNMRIHKEP